MRCADKKNGIGCICMRESYCICCICIRQSQKTMKPTVGFGWCELDDVICNVLGAAIGFGLWKMIKGKMHAVCEKDRLL